MRKAYIIGQTKGTKAQENFEKAEELLRNFQFRVFNPEAFERYISGFTTDEETINDFKLHFMEECDIVYILKDWIKSPEATIEYAAAKRLKLGVAWE